MHGQIVVGPPGSGKSTYCRGMKEFLQSVGRHVVVVNLDPANDARQVVVLGGTEAADDDAVDVNELVSLVDVMEELGLGPNGGLVYCIEFLETNLAWLEGKLSAILDEDRHAYFLFDLPGQVEISAHHSSLKNIMMTIMKRLNLRLTVVHLVDATHCSDASKYISAVFLSLCTMLRLELPHVNVLSKIDLAESDGELDFGLDFYTEVMDLNYLLPALSRPNFQPTKASAKDESESSGNENEEDCLQIPPPRTRFEEKFQSLNAAMVDLIDQFSLVKFHPLNIQDKQNVLRLIKHIDKTNEYINTMTEREAELFSAGTDNIDMMALLERYSPGAFSSP